MKHYAGLDVSQQTTSICIVDEEGGIVSVNRPGFSGGSFVELCRHIEIVNGGIVDGFDGGGGDVADRTEETVIVEHGVIAARFAQANETVQVSCLAAIRQAS